MKTEQRNGMRYNAFISTPGCEKCDAKDVRIDISDISHSGVGIATDERLGQGDKIKLEIVFPGDDIPMFIIGEVAWIRKHPEIDRMFDAGVRFMKLNRCDKERLLKYIMSNFL